MEFQKIPMNKCGIYMITSPSGKSYIGRSLNLKERLNKYKNLLCSEQQGVYHAILKYGWENMMVTILYKEWYSITEVSKTLGVNASGISHACKNGGKSHGYRWKYIS